MPKKLVAILAPQHAAAQAQLSTSRLRQLEALGELRAIRDSAGRRFYYPKVIEAFIRKREAHRRERERERQQANAEPQPTA